MDQKNKLKQILLNIKQWTDSLPEELFNHGDHCMKINSQTDLHGMVCHHMIVTVYTGDTKSKKKRKRNSKDKKEKKKARKEDKSKDQ